MHRIAFLQIKFCVNPNFMMFIAVKDTPEPKVGSTEYKSTTVLYRSTFSYCYRYGGYFFKNGTKVPVPRYFKKKVFGIFSFLLSLID